MRYYEIKKQSSLLLLEGGHAFKGHNGNSLTIQIKQKDIGPTVAWLEKITGIEMSSNLLGSTGKKPLSGDIDIGIDENKTSKDQMFNILRDWAEKQGHDPRVYIKKSGISIHFMCPILGDESIGHVQVDFMFGNDLNWMKFCMFGPGDTSSFSGADRYIAMSSLAKFHGLKLSQTVGLESRTSGKVISKSPQQVAEYLLGKKSQMDDLSSVETIINALKRNGITGSTLRLQLNDFIDNIAKIQHDEQKTETLLKLI